MALINCAECKTEVSDKAEACPKCGSPIQKQAESVSGRINATRAVIKIDIAEANSIFGFIKILKAGTKEVLYDVKVGTVLDINLTAPIAISIKGAKGEGIIKPGKKYSLQCSGFFVAKTRLVELGNL